MPTLKDMARVAGGVTGRTVRRVRQGANAVQETLQKKVKGGGGETPKTKSLQQLIDENKAGDGCVNRFKEAVKDEIATPEKASIIDALEWQKPLLTRLFNKGKRIVKKTFQKTK
jgi:hypothetical protein